MPDFFLTLLFCKAKPGRIVGSVVPYENGKNTKDGFDSKVFYRHAVLPPQNISPHCFYRTTSKHREKSGIQPQFTMVAKPAPGMVVDINNRLYYHPQTNSDQLTDRLPIDAKLLHAQTQFGAVGAAAVAVAAHRNVGTVQYGLS